MQAKHIPCFGSCLLWKVGLHAGKPSFWERAVSIALGKNKLPTTRRGQ